jgi:acid phosphatase type 7
LMPVPGNHDRQDGLGAQLYYDLFSLPENGPEKVEKESSYAFEYGNALFLMIDATSDVGDHTAWIEEKLSSTKATWKFVMFHFPPYNFEEPYPDIQQAWVPLFDKYHVDMVMGGHIHYYMRSHPMFDGKVVDDYSEGTVYAISISIPSKHDNMTEEPYAVKQFDEGYFYQRMDIDGKVLRYTTVDSNGEVKDTFTIQK